ncbi:MAG: AAC(3) family N-acetyltransferase [Gemmatimonadetes bacterium]|jgi:aminoglycoside 3-N-acetyltransferase|nr:AAC(3) family N-acetyltransferase [Gemmatimonadota bacterium]
MNEPAEVVSQTDIRKGVLALDIAPGEVVMVHSSLSAFGYVEGGADAVIDGFRNALGPAGTLVMPTFTWNAFHARERVEFDVCRTPCETGCIPETFRNRPGVSRSLHVCHSVAAVGPDAAEVMGEGVSSFGPGSSFDALLRLDAWIAFLGVSCQCCTALHAVEEFVGVPYRAHRDFQGSVVTLPDGTRMASRSIEYLRQEVGSNDFAKLEAILEEAGVLNRVRIGAAGCMAVRIRHLFEVTRPLLERDAGFLTRSPSS